MGKRSRNWENRREEGDRRMRQEEECRHYLMLGSTFIPSSSALEEESKRT